MAASRFPILRGADVQQSRVQDNVQGVLGPVAQALQGTPIMGAPPPAWIAPSPTNGWSNIGGAYAPLGFHKDALGYVHFRGYLLAGTLNTAAFTLPLGFRPKYRMTFSCYAFIAAIATAQADAAIATAQAEVRQDGQVFLNCAVGTVEVALDVVTFLAEA